MPENYPGKKQTRQFILASTHPVATDGLGVVDRLDGVVATVVLEVGQVSLTLKKTRGGMSLEV